MFEQALLTEVVMIEKFEVPLISAALGTILIVFAIVLIVIALLLLYKIWTADPVLLKEYRQLKLLADRANIGHKGAQWQCENDCRIKKSMYFCKKTQLPRTNYSVQQNLLWQIWGHY